MSNNHLKIQKEKAVGQDTKGLQTVEALRKVVIARYVGPSPAFSELHVLRALFLIGEKGSMGRAALAQSLGIGQGMVRTLIQRLRSAGMVTVEPGGCVLTKKGGKVYAGFRQNMSLPQKIDAGKLAVDRHSAAILLRNAGGKMKLGIEQRDAAVRAGATGATTIVFRDGKFLIPTSSEDSEKEFANKVWGEIRVIFAPKHNDVIIVCSAKSQREADYGGLAAALTLMS